MKNALISPLEPRVNGYRVADVSDVAFDVATPFFWVACEDDLLADTAWYNPDDGSFVLLPVPAPPTPNQPISEGAQTL